MYCKHAKSFSTIIIYMIFQSISSLLFLFSKYVYDFKKLIIYAIGIKLYIQSFAMGAVIQTKLTFFWGRGESHHIN